MKINSNTSHVTVHRITLSEAQAKALLAEAVRANLPEHPSRYRQIDVLFTTESVDSGIRTVPIVKVTVTDDHAPEPACEPRIP